MDLVFGLAVYIVTTLGFDRAFSSFDLCVVVFFALGPDLDCVPYFLFRRRFGWSSHWFIHFPLLYIPIGGALVWLATRGNYYITAFFLTSLSHFLHDSKLIEGVQWFWPISRVAHTLIGFRFVEVPEAERRSYYAKLAENASDRSILDEVMIRLGPWRPRWMRRK